MMEFNIFGREVKLTTASLVKMTIALVLYILFLFWVKSWLGIIVIPFIIDNYTTRFIPWGWWKKSENQTLKKVMSWVDAIVFALVAVYFVHIYFFQNYVIPTSSLEKSLLVGDYLFVSKVNYGPRKPQTPLSLPLVQHTMPIFGCKSYTDLIQWDYERVPGLEEIERNDIVVFNYPAGDIATTNPGVIDFHGLCYAYGKQELGELYPITDTTPAEESKPADNAGDTKAEAEETKAADGAADATEGGCGGAVSLAGIALVAALGTCTAFVAKKKED